MRVVAWLGLLHAAFAISLEVDDNTKPCIGDDISLSQADEAQIVIQAASEAPSRGEWTAHGAKVFTKHKPAQYDWTTALMEQIATGKANDAAVKDGKPATPLFLIMGTCPSMLVPMQVLMMVQQGHAGSGALDFGVQAVRPNLDFWWIKPTKDGKQLEPGYLTFQDQGKQKNAPGASRPVFQGIADLFQSSSNDDANSLAYDRYEWTVELVGGTARAVVRNDASGEALYLYMVWIEDWTANPMASKKYVRGKLLYQLDPTAPVFYDRTFDVVDGQVRIAKFAGDPFGPSSMPSAKIKEGCTEDDILLTPA